jgi:hypothetical protein
MSNYWENPFWRPRNGYGGANPITGDRQDFYDTPEVRDDPDNPSAPYGEWERFLTEQGYGGMSNKAQWGRSLYNRAQSGFDAAQLSNPGVTWRDYLNTLEGGWLDNLYAGLSPQQRGAFLPGQTRVIRWG